MKDHELKMNSAVESVESEFRSIRTGRANPALLDKIHPLYYGNPTPLKNMANISTPDGRTIVITPYDKGSLKDIEKGIQESDLGLTANNDGSVVRVVVPPLTEERRKDLVKLVKEIAEKGKVAIRNIRRDALDKNKNDADATEDDKHKYQDDMQKMTDKYVKLIDEMISKKEEEMMTV